MVTIDNVTFILLKNVVQYGCQTFPVSTLCDTFVVSSNCLPFIVLVYPFCVPSFGCVLVICGDVCGRVRCVFVSVYVDIPYDPITDTVPWTWKKSP
jgi:hypothetical protein